MVERYGRWIAVLIVLALLLAVVILFGTVDLNLDESTLTDVRSAPVLSNDAPAEDMGAPFPTQTENPPQEQATPAPGD